MENLEFNLSLKDGSLMPGGIDSGADLIFRLFGDDYGPPARGLAIVAKTDDGRIVRISLAPDASPRAHVKIENVED